MSRRLEYSLIALLACGALIFNVLPYIYQGAYTPKDVAAIGAYPVMFDKPTYLAEMRQGFEGSWKIINRFSHEPQQPVFLYSFYTGLGHVARITNLSLEQIFLVSRFVFGLILLGVVIWTLYSFLKTPEQRVIGALLIFFGSGIGWLPGAPYQSLDLWIPDFVPMVRFSYFPHFSAAHALFFSCIVLMHSALRNHTPRHATIAGILAGILAVILPFHLLTLYPLIVLLALLLTCKKPVVLKKAAPSLAIFFALSLPLFLFQLSIGLFDPFWRAVEKANILEMPSVDVVIFGTGLLLLFFVGGIRRMITEQGIIGVFIFLWVFLALLSSYIIPLPIHRRFIEIGLFIPLALGATYGIQTFFECLNRKRWGLFTGAFVRMSAVVIVVIGLCGSNVRAWKEFTSLVDAHNDPRLFMRTDIVEGLRTIEQYSSSSDTILSSFITGNLIPALSNRTVFLGHGPFTLNLKEKSEQAYLFYTRSIAPSDAYALLESIPARIIIETPFERGEFSTPLNTYYPFLEPVFANEALTIYHRKETYEKNN